MTPPASACSIERDEIGRVRGHQLIRREANSRGGRLGRVVKKSAQQTDRAELNRNAKSIVVAPVFGNKGAVGVVEMEVGGETWDGGDATQACGASGLSFDLPGTGFTTAYTYNLAAHSLTVSQGAQSPRIFQTDAAGRTVSMTEPESGTTTLTYAYNGTGLQTVRTRPRANQTNATVTTATTTQYDTIGRVLDITYNDGTPRKHFVYDAGVPGGLVSNSGPGAKGQLTGTATVDANNSVINAGGIAYDIMGRVNQTADCPTGWCSNPALTGYRAYNYDLASQLTYEAYSTQPNGGGGYSVAYGYNVAGQLTSFIDGQNSAVGAPNIYSATASTMQPGGPQFITYGNNTTAWRQYDNMNRLTGQWVCGLPGGYNCPNGSHYFYGYSTVRSGSMLTAEVDTVNGDWSQYSYDSVGNLSSAHNWYGNASNGFAAGYDRYGNRWGESVTHTANGTGPNQSLSFNTTKNQINSAGFVYDAAGNLISDGAHSYQYDAENNLLQIDNGNTATFYYTAQNRRDAVVNSAGVFRFGFDANGRRSTQWDNNSASVNQTQYYAAGEAVAFWSAVDGNINFEYHDWIGTARMRTDLNGNPATAASFSSLPFGEPNATGGADLDSTHFAGLDQNGSFSASSLGLHHATFREYNSTLGRWMSPDPYTGSYDLRNPQSLNRYSYVLNNPLTNFDHSGHSCVNGSFGGGDNGGGDSGGGDDGDDDNTLRDDDSLARHIRGHAYDSTPADNGDGQGCAAAGIAAGDPSDPSTDRNPGNGTNVYCGADCDSQNQQIQQLAAGTSNQAGWIGTPQGIGSFYLASAIGALIPSVAIDELEITTVRLGTNAHLPPGWNSNWIELFNARGGLSWFDEEGGPWRAHFPDSWHDEFHWDYNTNDEWNSQWTNIYP